MISKIITFAKEKFSSLDKKLVLVLCLSAIVMLFALSKQSYGLDESFSIYISRNWSFMTGMLWHQEANMWLYYFILHFWLVVAKDEFSVRLLSTFFAILSVAVIYKIAEHLFNKRVAFISGLLVSVNMFLLFYAQEARGYSLSLFFVSLASYLFLRLKDSGNKKYKLAYIVTLSLAVYAHFYAALAIFTHFLLAVFEKKIRIYFSSFLMAGLLLIPIFISPSFRSHQVAWITKPAVASLAGTFFVLSGDFPLLMIIYASLFIYLIFTLKRSFRDFRNIFLLSWLVIPIILLFVFSVSIKPIYQSVYFLVCLPPFVILAASVVDKINKVLMKNMTIVLILVFSAVRLLLWYTENTKYKMGNNKQNKRLEVGD